MSHMEGPHVNAELAGSRGNQLRVSNLALRRMERERRRKLDLRLDKHETRMDSVEASSQGEWIVLYVPEPSYHNDRDREIESLWRHIRELELEMRGWHRRRDYDHGSASDHIGGSPHWIHSHLLKDKSNESRITRSHWEKKGIIVPAPTSMPWVRPYKGWADHHSLKT